MRGKFRGAKLELHSVHELSALPELLSGLDKNNYILDRWVPLNKNDKIITSSFPERKLGWVSTSNESVIYGLERWGEIYTDYYVEYFAIIVIRNKFIPAQTALRLAEKSNQGGLSFIIT